uniref:Uncharacterized protein n=2 Tax=Caenorhabditis japonica TaxID=281687 RepID=A0A8R1IL12_CAEJA
MKILLVLLSFSTLKISLTDLMDGEQYVRMMNLDALMQQMNLTNIHFSDPGLIVNVETVVNEFNPENFDIDRRLKEKVVEVANKLVNGSAAERGKIIAAAIDPGTPAPFARIPLSATSPSPSPSKTSRIPTSP